MSLNAARWINRYSPGFLQPLVQRLKLPCKPLGHLLAGFSVLILGCTMAMAGDSAVILQYHHVSNTSPPATSISPERFREHMAYLAENGFTILPLEDVLVALQKGDSLPDKSAVITFDDAYVSVYEEAFPLLREYDWPFTVFVTAGLVGSNARLYSTWAQLREMGEHQVTLANHSMTHPYFLERSSGQSESDWLAGVQAEIEEAEALIEKETGQSHKLHAYPYGEYNTEIQQLIKQLGYVGIAQQSGPINASSDFTALPRFPFGGIYVGMNSYRTKVNSLAFDVHELAPRSPVTSESSPEAFLHLSMNGQAVNSLSCFNSDEAIAVTRENEGFRINTHIDNKSRRFRYNCTAPGPDGRFYWYSIHWVNPAIPE